MCFKKSFLAHQYNNLLHLPPRDQSVSGLLPTRSTRNRPIKVQKKFTDAVAQASQMAME